MIDLNRVLTFTEAAEKWGLAGGNTLRQAVLRGKFEPHEIKKSGTVWLTTYDAMHRVFGEPHADIFQIPLVEIIASLKKTQATDRESFNKRIAQALENSQKLAIPKASWAKKSSSIFFPATQNTRIGWRLSAEANLFRPTKKTKLLTGNLRSF